MNIHIRFIPDSEQRYFTLGDWYFDNEDLVIAVTKDSPYLRGQDEQFLVALHELVEAWLCMKRGITQQEVDKFDFNHESKSDEEPGDHPEAPYRKEHRFAMLIEHMMAHELGILGYGVVR